MAQLFFKYGAMNSGKSIEILKVAHNYEEQNKPVLLFTSAIDDRDQVGYVSSRIGVRREAIPIFEETPIYEIVEGQAVKYLLLYADKIEEIKTICWYCHKKASMNMRVVDGVPVYTGEQIQIGGNDAYYPVCRYHYNHPGEERL